MADRVLSLFEEYVESYDRGELPDLRELLERAGEGRDELASLVDVWLQVAPTPEPDDEAVALAHAWIAGEPPLVALRTRRNLKRDVVVDVLVKMFALDPKKRLKVARYYHDVETGQLAPSPRIRDALAAIFGRALPDLRPRPLDTQVAFHRAPLPAQSVALDAVAPPPEPWDEVDELFRGA